MRHVVMFSGGSSSWAAGKLVSNRYGTSDLTLLFADTLMEDEDLYRFLDDAAANIGVEVVWLKQERLQPPRLYDLGFSHNNCGGFCIKAGQSQFKLLLETMPDRYAYHERREQELCEYLGKKVSILRDRRQGHEGPLTLKEFRERLQSGDIQLQFFGNESCSCMVSEPELGGES